MTNDYRNILIVRTDRIGDVILTTPAIAAVRAHYPKSRITVLVSAATRELVDGNPNIDEVLVDDRRGAYRGVFNFWRLVMMVRSKKFDLAIIFHTKKRTNLLCFLAGIKNRVGYRDKNFGSLLTEGVKDDRHLGEKHESKYCLDLLKSLGVNPSQSDPYLPVRPDAGRWIDQWVTDNRLTGIKLIAVHAGASDPDRCWPVESFASLIDRLSQLAGCKVVVFGAGHALEVAKRLKTLCVQPYFDLTGQTSIAQTVALMKRSHLLISNDSGPVHIAAAVGIYVISLFLRDQPGINPERWRPLGSKSYVLSNKPEDAIRLDSSGQIISGIKDSISVDQVFELARDILQRP